MMKFGKKDFIGYALITGIVTFLMLLTFNYWDGQTLMVWSVSNWDILVEGRIRDFYVEKQLNLRGAIQTDGCSSPLMLIPQMLWNFPIWLTHYFNGNLYVGTVACVYWYKLFLVVMTVLCGGVCYRLIYLLSGGKKENAILGGLLVCASPEVLLSTMYTGQDEIVYLLFILLALYSALSNRKKSFLAWSVCAVTCCPIMLIPFGIILLLKEKRLSRIIADSLIVLLPTIVWALVSIGAPSKSEVAIDSGSFVSEMMELLGFNTTTGTASVAGIMLVLLACWCYFDNRYSFDSTADANSQYGVIWYVTAAMMLISFLMNNFFYRLLLYVPFIVILILGKERKENDGLSLNLLLLTVLAYLRMFVGGYESPQNMNTSYVVKSSLILKICEWTGSTKYDTYDDLNSKMISRLPTLANYVSLMNATVIAIVLILLYVNHPRCRKEYEVTVPCKASAVGYILCMPLYLLVFYGLLFH